jgi:hypothetical protein
MVIKSNRVGWFEHGVRTGEVMNRKSEMNRPFGRPKRRWEDNIKTDLKETGCDNLDWIRMAQDKVQ